MKCTNDKEDASKHSVESALYYEVELMANDDDIYLDDEQKKMIAYIVYNDDTLWTPIFKKISDLITTI